MIIPKDTAPNQPISVIIRGVGTVKKDVFSTTVPANFTGDLCFKAFERFLTQRAAGVTKKVNGIDL